MVSNNRRPKFVLAGAMFTAVCLICFPLQSMGGVNIALKQITFTLPSGTQEYDNDESVPFDTTHKTTFERTAPFTDSLSVQMIAKNGWGSTHVVSADNLTDSWGAGVGGTITIEIQITGTETFSQVGEVQCFAKSTYKLNGGAETFLLQTNRRITLVD